MSAVESVLLTPQDVAKKLRLDYQRVITLCLNGTIPCVNLKAGDTDRKNNCFRIDPVELEKWLSALRVQKPEPRKISRKKGRYDDLPATPSPD